MYLFTARPCRTAFWSSSFWPDTDCGLVGTEGTSCGGRETWHSAGPVSRSRPLCQSGGHQGHSTETTDYQDIGPWESRYLYWNCKQFIGITGIYWNCKHPKNKTCRSDLISCAHFGKPPLLSTGISQARVTFFPVVNVSCARNLGVIFDKNFTFRSHISAVCSSCFYHMRDLRCIHCHLDLDNAKLLATALVSSRLDYCNSLLYGIADIDLTRFQHVQNQLVRLVTKSSPCTCSLPLFRSLHWLPGRFRILFKINLLTCKTLRGKQPVYLHSMLAASIPSCSLRSNNDNSLSVPRVKTNTDVTAFQSCAPSLWNNLPLFVHSASSVATFKKYLKIHLFDLAFTPQIPSLPMACWCYRTVSSIWLLHHWAWLCQVYWRYRNLIDWLQLKLIPCTFTFSATFSKSVEPSCIPTDQFMMQSCLLKWGGFFVWCTHSRLWSE